MNSRRLIFVRGPRVASMAPVYAALLLLTMISLVALLVAIWPRDPAPSAYRPAAETASASRPVEGGLRIPAQTRELPGRTRGI